MKKHRYLFIFSAVMLLVAALLVSKSFADQEVFLKGRVLYVNEGGGTIDILREFPEEKRESYRQYDLLITRSGGNYYWASNGNKKLIKINLDQTEFGSNRRKYIIFLNPEGYGQIFVRDDSVEKGNLCDVVPPNYSEYRIDKYGGDLNRYSGNTDPFPYPYPRPSKCHWN